MTGAVIEVHMEVLSPMMRLVVTTSTYIAWATSYTSQFTTSPPMTLGICEINFYSSYMYCIFC